MRNEQGVQPGEKKHEDELAQGLKTIRNRTRWLGVDDGIE